MSNANIPKDPMILLSYINTKLRDIYPSLDILCNDLLISKEDLIDKLNAIGYNYDVSVNRFI